MKFLAVIITSVVLVNAVDVDFELKTDAVKVLGQIDGYELLGIVSVHIPVSNSTDGHLKYYGRIYEFPPVSFCKQI